MHEKRRLLCNTAKDPEEKESWQRHDTKKAVWNGVSQRRNEKSRDGSLFKWVWSLTDTTLSRPANAGWSRLERRGAK